MLPSLESLQCFVTATRTLNFRAAAQAVALTPAALGQRIKQLEAQVGGPLFHRTTRSVVLTELGLELLPRAENALVAASACVQIDRGPEGKRARQVFDMTLGTRHELGMSWVLPNLHRLSEDQPWVSYNLYFGSGADLLLRVRTLEVECAITSSRFDDDKLDAFPLHPEAYAFVASPKLLAKMPLRTAKDALRHNLVDIAGSLPLFRYFHEAAGSAALSFGRVMAMGTIAAIKHVVLAGKGVAVLPSYFVAPELEKGSLVAVFPKVKLLEDRFRLVFRRDDPRRPIYERMASVLATIPLR